MTRLAHSYVDLPAQRATHTSLATTAEEFHEVLDYDAQRFETREGFLAAFAARGWVEELGVALRPLLERDRTILSLGSGKGEHEVLLFLDGYGITASDLDERALEDARRLFPGFATMRLDALAPNTTERWDDILVTGLDYALDDAQLTRLLANARRLLNPGGRVLFVHRFHDNAVTRLLDGVVLPAWVARRRARHLLRRDGVRVVRREHGWRRTRAEIRSLATAAGYRVGRVTFALLGRELERVPLPRVALRLARRADKRLHIFNTATIFELLPA